MNRKFIVLFLFFIISRIIAQSLSNDAIPERIILNLTAYPSTELAVTWRTISGHTNSEVQYAVSTKWTDFKKNILIQSASNSTLEIGNGKSVVHYSAVLKNLQPDTKYLYRVGHDSVWSEWNQFTTAKQTNSPFKFVFFGDPQNEIKEHCSRIFRQAFKTAPDANFWLFTGDLASDPFDNLWGELFCAGDFIFRMIPSILTPGNHDHPPVIVNGKSERLKTISSTWTSHFTLPENGLKNLKETSYYVDYQGVRFVMLNTYTHIDEQALWLDSLLSDNKNKWTVVSFHYPIYSMGKDRDSKSTRKAFQPIFDKYKVDLVLTGHDHTYARSYRIKNGSVVNGNEAGTVYVLSVSGPKMYELGKNYVDLMAKTGENHQLFQVIEVNGNTLSFKAYTADGSIFDSFELSK